MNIGNFYTCFTMKIELKMREEVYFFFFLDYFTCNLNVRCNGGMVNFINLLYHFWCMKNYVLLCICYGYNIH